MAGTLPRPINDAAVVTPVSATRLLQLGAALESAWDALLPRGVLSGGLVTPTTGFAVEVANGSVFVAEGYKHTLGSAQSYASATNTSTNIRLWGKVLRTAATQANRADPDTYTLSLTHTFGASYATEPASGPWFPLADWNTGGSGLSGGIDNGPAGKYLKAGSPLWQGETVIASGEVVAVGSGESLFVFPTLQVRGRVIVRGALRVRGWN